MRKGTLIFLLVAGSIAVKARQKNDVIIVTGRVLSAADSNRAERNFYTALKEKTMGNPDQAEIYFKKVVETDPQNDAALYELGRISLAENKDAEAEKYIRKAVTVNSDNKWYWMLLGDIYKKDLQPEKLLPVLDELIRLDPDNQNYYIDKANALLVTNKAKEAGAVLDETEERFGASGGLDAVKNRLSQKLETPAATESRLKKLIRESPDNVNNYLALSEFYVRNGQIRNAQSVLKKAQKKAPDNSFIHLLKSDAYQAEGRAAESFSELCEAFRDKKLPVDIKIRIILSYFSRLNEPAMLTQAEQLASITAEAHPSDPKALAMLGDVLFQAKKPEEARQSYKKALELDKNVYLIWLQLLQIETEINDFSAAVADGNEAIELYPTDPDLYFFTALAYNGTGNYEKEVEYLKNAASLNPKKQVSQAQIYSNLGSALNRLRKYKESDEAFDTSLKLAPDNAFTLNNYAYYLSLRGEQLDKAEEMAKKANQLQPSNSSFEDTYAWVLFMKKNYTDARVWIEKAIKNNSNSAVLYEHYGDILFYLGERDLAVEQWTRARDKGIKTVTLERKINEKKFFE